MNAPRVTDAQLAQALRAHLPEHARAGLLERTFEAVETTAQQGPLPSFLGALSDADPVARRRSLLIAAALLMAVAIATAAAVGAFRLLDRDPIQELNLAPPADVAAFVLSSYERLPELPPLAMSWQDGDGSDDRGRIYVDRSGAVRFDRFASAAASEPSSYTILRSSRISGLAPVGSEAVWVEPGHEAFGEDPRVWIRTVLNSEGGPGCEMERDPGAADDGSAATGWRYVGVEYVAGRPTHHFACDGEIWLDIETRLILRVRDPETDDAGQPIPGQFGGREVTEIVFGEQPADLFEAPEGVAHVTSQAYMEYLCTRDVGTDVEVGFGVRDCAAAEPEATLQPEATPPPTPTASVRPRPSGPAGPLAWSESRLDEDWPVPVRPEPVGGAPVLPILLNIVPDGPDSCCKVFEQGEYQDPEGDTAREDFPWVDIHEVGFCEGQSACIRVTLVSNHPPAVDPSELWIAYGVVVDDDGDGVPDRRFGIDNTQVGAPGDPAKDREWITDLRTGRTVLEDDFGDTFFDTFYPPGPGEVGARLSFGGDATGGGKIGGLPERYYAWASVIENGRVVATDYAPDVGWLETSATAPPVTPPGLGPRPSGPAGHLAWSESRLDEDWPAPVRPEPAGGAGVAPVEDGRSGERTGGLPHGHQDPSGDTGSSVVPWVDIREVGFGGTKVTLDLVSNIPPSVDPTEQWIAYGVVVDDDRDGVPDWRYGMDNMPVDATGERPYRAWRTNLHTGRTESAAPASEHVGDTYFDTYFPPSNRPWTFSFGFNVTGGGTKGGVPGAFYAWASVIENGRVVATDYAPNVGWLLAPEP